MKDIFVRFVFLYIFFSMALEATALETGFRGSSEEIKTELFSIFPMGLHKTEVISIATSKLDVDRSEIKSHCYGEEPLLLDQDGKKLLVYSWVEMNLAEYRSVRKFFIKTTVGAKFFFDKDDNLSGIDVRLYGDSL